jgi:hypothetical protein
MTVRGALSVVKQDAAACGLLPQNTCMRWECAVTTILPSTADRRPWKLYRRC